MIFRVTLRKPYDLQGYPTGNPCRQAGGTAVTLAHAMIFRVALKETLTHVHEGENEGLSAFAKLEAQLSP